MVQAIATTIYRKANSGKIASSTSPLKHNVPAPVVPQASEPNFHVSGLWQ